MRTCTIIFLLLFCNKIFADTIKGKVLDEDGRPIGYANIVLLTSDSIFIDGEVTSDTGDFIFRTIQITSDTYRLKISSVGFEPVEITVNSNDIGEIHMRSQTNDLSEILVTPPTYTMKGNGLVVSVQNSALSQLEDVGKMLEFMPGIQSNEDGLYVFGKGKPLIYLNGRILADMSELERLSPSDIATVEIIRNPGAAYSSSSQAVVKIKTIRKKGDGLGGDVKSYFQLAKRIRFGETFQTNYRTEKFDVFAYLSYLYADDYEKENSVYDIKSTDPFSLNSTQKSYTERNRYTGKIGFDYYFTQRQNIGAYYSFIYHDNKVKSNETVAVFRSGHDSDDQVYQMRHKIYVPSHRINAYYSGHIGSIDINFNNDLYWSVFRQSQVVDGFSGIHGSQLATNSNRLKNSLCASDLSLSYQKGKGLLEVGTTYNFTRRTNSYDSEGGVGLSVDQRIRENKWATYANYELSLDKWEFTAGLRYELYKYDYYRDGRHIREQSKIYRDLYPSMNISHSIGNANINLSYSSRSEKPHYNALDGNIQYVSRNLYTGGNPLLKPSNIYDIQLSMLYKELVLSADYIVKKNPIYNTYRFYDEQQDIILASYDNYPKVNFLQAQASYSKKFGIWKPQLTADFLMGDYVFEQAGKKFRMDKPLFSITFNNILSFPRQWYVYLYTLYQTDGCNEMGAKMKDRGRISLLVMKKWKNFSVDVLINDMTRSYTDAYSAISPVCTFHTNQYFDTQNIQFNFRYSFNAARSKYKGTDAAAEEINRM